MDIPVLGRILDTIVLPKGVSIKRGSRDQRLILNEMRRMYELTLIYRREEAVVSFGEYDTYGGLYKDPFATSDSVSRIPASSARGVSTPPIPSDTVADAIRDETPVLSAEDQKREDEFNEKVAFAKGRIADGVGTPEDTELVAEAERKAEEKKNKIRPTSITVPNPPGGPTTVPLNPPVDPGLPSSITNAGTPFSMPVNEPIPADLRNSSFVSRVDLDEARARIDSDTATDADRELIKRAETEPVLSGEDAALRAEGKNPDGTFIDNPFSMESFISKIQKVAADLKRNVDETRAA